MSYLLTFSTKAVNNCATATVRASASGTIFCIGSLSGIIAPWVYLSKDAPNYRTGHGILLALLLGSWVIAALLRLYCQWENRQRDMGKRDHLLQGLTPEEEQDLSSSHPAFRYLI